MNNRKIKIELTELEAMKIIRALAAARGIEDGDEDALFTIAGHFELAINAAHGYSQAIFRATNTARRRGFIAGMTAAEKARGFEILNSAEDAA